MSDATPDVSESEGRIPEGALAARKAGVNAIIDQSAEFAEDQARYPGGQQGRREPVIVTARVMTVT